MGFERGLVPESVKNEKELGCFLVDRHYADVRYLRPGNSPSDRMGSFALRMDMPQPFPLAVKRDLFPAPPVKRLEFYERDLRAFFDLQNGPVPLSELPDRFSQRFGYLPRIFSLKFVLERLGASVFPTHRGCDYSIKLT